MSYLKEEEEVEDETPAALIGRRRRHLDANNANGTTSTEGNGFVMENGVENNTESNHSVYYDNNQGTSIDRSNLAKLLKDVDIQEILTAAINAKGRNEISSDSQLPPSMNVQEENGTNPIGQPQNVTENIQIDIVDEVDEEVIELEFERAVEKMHTHQYNMYCPNCSNRITKVILRRRKTVKRVPASSGVERPDKPLDLFGCLSCFSIFTAAGNKLNPFRFFGSSKAHENSQLSHERPISDVSLSMSDTGSSIQQRHASSDITFSATTTSQNKVKAFDLFSIFGNGRMNKNNLIQQTSVPGLNLSRDEAKDKKEDKDSKQVHGTNTVMDFMGNMNGASHGHSTIGTPLLGKPLLGVFASNGEASIAEAVSLLQTPPQDSLLDGNVVIDINIKSDTLIQGEKHAEKLEDGSKEEQNNAGNMHRGGNMQVTVEERSVRSESSQLSMDVRMINRAPSSTEAQSSKSLDILKAIVYGGLIESIASLGVVSSAAASDATTLNIVALGLANLMGGLVILGHNLRDLKYGEFSHSEEELKRYNGLLGRRENFVLHAVVALLSYLAFGLIPPVIYGFTFRENDDRELKLLAVAVASLLCIVILAIGKAYTRGQHKFMAYFKTVMYYVIFAVLVSGIAYAVGDLVKKLLERLKLFGPAGLEALWILETKSHTPAWAAH